MPEYLLNIYQPEAGEPPADLAEIMREVEALNDELRAAGSWVFAAGLHAPDTATVVRARGSEILITDGPYVESKEYIAGFSLIRAVDLDEALAWGRRLAAILRGLPVEVRPVMGD
ncbi:YciI family protein [Nocardia sp. NPDC051570]|uniref:YciI family protein n=1 Tax=Nocardia sp. NPDC051570 TaxID=3364324 RepID=UPI0037B6EDA0